MVIDPRRVLAAVVLAALAACGQTGTVTTSPARPAVVDYGYQVVHTFPHDLRAFTEGLVMVDGSLYESTGSFGELSTLREVDPSTGRVLRSIELPGEYFGEGLTDFNGRLIQLTWRSGKAFVYDLKTFAKLGELPYPGEGWGLTQDGRSLIMSNGTDQIVYRDPATMASIRSIRVHDGSTPISMINELEYVRGEIYANVFESDTILRIDPASGAVLGRVDMHGLRPPDPRPDAVLNGIAYDPSADRLLVTGKLCPNLYEVRLTRR